MTDAQDPTGTPHHEPPTEPPLDSPDAAHQVPPATGGWPGEPTTPGGWPAGPAHTAGSWPKEPTTPGGWPAGGGQHQRTGWTPGASSWHPPGAGWVPPGGGWVPPGGGWTPPSPRPGRGRRHWTAGLVAVALVALLVGAGAVGYLVRSPATSTSGQAPVHRSTTFPFGGTTTSKSSTSGSSTSKNSSASGSPSNTAAIAAEVDPDLVDVNTTLKTQNEEAAGTGMVLTSTGEVLTNNHVIEGATTISVTDIGNGQTYSATVVGYDRTEDVAVLQLQNASGLKTVSLGNSSTAATGEGVVGIGNAGGVGGTPSVAGGSITAINQSITASDAGTGTSEKLTDLIETNCAIQPGDSGGPLVNTSGKVIGMDTAASEGSGGGGFYFRTPTGQTASNQGYAIPVNEAITLAKKIVAGDGSTTIHIGKTAFLGVEISGTSTTKSGSFGRFGFGTSSSPTATPSTTTTPGAHIAGVVSGYPAAQIGLAKGDVITEFAGKTITSATTLTSVIEEFHPGDKVKVVWKNGSGQQQSATVTLATGPAA